MNSEKSYQNIANWKQDYPELISYMQPFIEEWERIQLEISEYKESKEIIERIKNGKVN